MRNGEVKTGRVYVVKVSGRLAPVMLSNIIHIPGKGYRCYGDNLLTNRRVGPFTVAKCRREIKTEELPRWLAPKHEDTKEN